MRSVVVVLPASMCAMMPMLRTLFRSVVMSTATLLSQSLRFVCTRRAGSPGRVRTGPQENADPMVFVPRGPAGRSPAVVGESLVRLGHLVGVLALLHRGTEAVGGVEDLVHESLGHRLLATVRGVPDEPAQGQRGATRALDLDRHLVGRATDAAGLDLDRRLHVVHGALERD